MSWSVTKERGAGYRKSCENLVGKCQKRPEKRWPNRLRLGRQGEENGEVRLPSCCLSMPTTSQGLLSTAAFSTSRDSPLFGPGTKMPAIPHCVKINEDNARDFCASLAVGVMWHRRNALEYALPFYLRLVWTSTTAKTSDTKIPVCSIRAGALSAWSLIHKKEPETCGDDHHPHLPSPSRPSSSFSLQMQERFFRGKQKHAFWRVLAQFEECFLSAAMEGLAREKG